MLLLLSLADGGDHRIPPDLEAAMEIRPAARVDTVLTSRTVLTARTGPTARIRPTKAAQSKKLDAVSPETFVVVDPVTVLNQKFDPSSAVVLFSLRFQAK